MALMGFRDARQLWPANAGICRGAALDLPSGEVIAADGIQYQPGEPTVLPLWDEAYVIVQLHDGMRWQATWQPYAQQWQTQRVEHSWFLPDVEHALPAP